jgi:hypothetical protein
MKEVPMKEMQYGTGVHRYPMAPLIRYCLLSLYGALVLPLPLLAPINWRWPVGTAVLLGFLLVLAATSEQVEIAETGVRVGHPAWCHWLLRRGWSLARFSAATGLDVGDVQRLTPPWTYQLLAVFSGLLLLAECLALFGLPHPAIA